jgi:hypothetical protein
VKGVSWQVGCGLSKGWNQRHTMPSRLSNSEPAYLDGILIISTIVVIPRVRSIIDFKQAMIFLTEGRSLSSESDISNSGDRSCNERDYPAAEALKSTVMHQARRVHRRKIEASGTTECCSIEEAGGLDN